MPNLLKLVTDKPILDGYTIEDVVRAYIKTRNDIKQIKERHEQELKKYYQYQELQTEWLLTTLKATGQEMARTKYGTVSAAVRDTASCSDPNMFIDYVRENNAYELMDRRPNSTACREFNDKHGMLPPGVKLNTIRYVNVLARAQTEDIT
jgi:hypothetical protein